MGYVLFVDGQLLDWAVSKKAARDVEAAQQVLEGWLRDLAPDVAGICDFLAGREEGNESMTWAG